MVRGKGGSTIDKVERGGRGKWSFGGGLYILPIVQYFDSERNFSSASIC